MNNQHPVLKAYDNALREYEVAHHEWMGTLVMSADFDAVTKKLNEAREKYLKAKSDWALQTNNPEIPQIGGSMVIKRTEEAIFIRLPKELQRPIEGGCICEICLQRKISNRDFVPTWDTLAVAIKAPKSGNDYVWTVHMPMFSGKNSCQKI